MVATIRRRELWLLRRRLYEHLRALIEARAYAP